MAHSSPTRPTCASSGGERSTDPVALQAKRVQRTAQGQGGQAVTLADGRSEQARQTGLLRWMATSPRLQRQCACGAPSAGGGSCSACEATTPPQGLQRKTFTIGAVDDPLEREADQVAERVMGMEAPSATPMEMDQHVRPRVSRSTNGGAVAGEAPPSVQATLTSPGQPLAPSERAFFEPRFGMDFSQVRVHTDSKATESARVINAAAYTAGSHIVFGTGNLPGQNALTAHELTHVIQQTTHTHKRVNWIQRSHPIVTGDFGIAQGIEEADCLYSLFDELNRQTNWFLPTACSNGDYTTTLSGVRYISESDADAFGHCWIGCQGTRTCGEGSTGRFGRSYEEFREAMRYLTLGLWDHNSYEEDTFNQAHGRELARNNPDRDCSNLCYGAVVNDTLRFHGHQTGPSERPRVYNCSDITIDGNEYHQGWRYIHFSYLQRF
jgi:hypothetical protein